MVTYCLIDTGASLTILSLKTWDIISRTCSSKLVVFKSKIYTASGEHMQVKGKTSVNIEIGGVSCITDVIVADIDMDTIIGLDFLKAHNCQLDMVNDTLKVGEQNCKLNLAGKIGCYRVTVSEPIEIPARSEMIIKGKVCVPEIREKRPRLNRTHRKGMSIRKRACG